MTTDTLRTTLSSMPVNSETSFALSRHGNTTTFRIRRTEDGWREQNDLYGMEDGAYGLPMDLDSMVAEINSILDK
jgi:hypothetical protein